MVPYYLYFLAVQIALLIAIGQCRVHRGAGTEIVDLDVVFEWNTADYIWPSERARDEAIKRKEYIPKNIAILDVDVYDPMTHNLVCKENNQTCAKIKRRYFVTSPRVNRGVPAVLSTVSDRVRNGKNLLKPFPDWAHNREGNCDGLTSVFRTQIDECGRLWVLDTGVVDSFAEKPRRICSPQILVFDLNAGDKLVGRYQIPKNVLEHDSLLITIIVDIRDGKCKDAFAYITDVIAFKLIVFDARRETFHRVVHNTFYPYPDHGDFNIAGTQFELMDGLFGLALGPVENNDRKLFYHSFASVRESWVLTSTIQDRAAFSKNERSYSNQFHSFSHERVSQSGPEAMNKDGILFFTQMELNGVSCWNSLNTYRVDTCPIIAQNDVTMQFPSGLKLHGDNLFVMSSRLQNYLSGSISEEETNYRVLAGYVPRLIRHTTCDNSDWTDYYNYGDEIFGPDLASNLNSVELNEYNPPPHHDKPLSLSNFSTELNRPSYQAKYNKCDLSKDPKCYLKFYDPSSHKGILNHFKYGSPGFKFYKGKSLNKPPISYNFEIPYVTYYNPPPSAAYPTGISSGIKTLDNLSEPKNRTKVASSTTNIIYYNPIKYPPDHYVSEPVISSPYRHFGDKIESKVKGGFREIVGELREAKVIPPPSPKRQRLQSFYSRPPKLYEYTINHPGTSSNQLTPDFRYIKMPSRRPHDQFVEVEDTVRSPFSRVRFLRSQRRRK